jgi:dTDP-4-dehydrorhamnose reductase
MIQLKMLQEKLMVIDNNVIEGYIDVLYLALVIRMCFERNITNRLFQLSSKDYLTRFDFVKLYCKYFNGNDGLVQRGAWQFYQMEGYPGSSKGLWYKMDIFNLESYLGVELPTIDESLSFTFQRLGGNLNNSKVKEKSSEGIKYI